MKTEAKELQEFKIKGELIGTINLTDTFKKVKELTNHLDNHKFLYVLKGGEIVKPWDLEKVKDDDFPILVVKLFNKSDLADNLFNEE